MASSCFGSSGVTPHTMTMMNTPATRLLPMSLVRSSKLNLGLVAGNWIYMMKMFFTGSCILLIS
ncbi:hypothetical protein Scep_012464 [Stephania cephalantha]|uniref:Uncharacterized protein n=1 Tax=Stephania cephalantha TaxID=152367 RepID=A0AAP0JEZ0_9MAGN